MQKKDWLAMPAALLAVIAIVKLGLVSLPKEWWDGLTPWRLIFEVSLLSLMVWAIDRYRGWLRRRFWALQVQISELASTDYVDAEIQKRIAVEQELARRLSAVEKKAEQGRLDSLEILFKVIENEKRLPKPLENSAD